MLELLKKYNYEPPEIVPGIYGDVEIKKSGYEYGLFVKGQQWMAYDSLYHREVFELFSHYFLAKGHVIVTGLGFGARENWILTKKEVTKLTIIEQSQDVINYHKQIKSPFLKDPRVKIINKDPNIYEEECDVLLLDHFKFETNDEIIYFSKQVSKNIKHKTIWLWPFERIIMHSRKWHIDNDHQGQMITKHYTYNLLKKNNPELKLPELDKETLQLFIFMFQSQLISNSEKFLSNQFQDKTLFHEVYRNI